MMIFTSRNKKVEKFYEIMPAYITIAFGTFTCQPFWLCPFGVPVHVSL